MKKILLLTCLIILIPFLVVNIFIKDEEIKFIYTNNMKVRVKQEDKIVNVPFEDYIVGVLAGEMPISFELEALKAQAVAARSYVLKKMEYNLEKEYDVVDTVMNQVYLSDDYLKEAWQENYTDNINKIKQAVLETAGEYLVYDDEVIDAMFFSTSVGFTENSEEVFTSKLPYLRSVSSTWDSISPVYEVNYEFSLEEFYQKLDLKYQDNIEIIKVKTTSTGRIKEIKINGVLFQGSEVVDALKLKSNHFTIKQDGNDVYITTKGYGHGVGMSQYGAQAMALKGYNYQDILKYYYQGVELKKI